MGQLNFAQQFYHLGPAIAKSFRNGSITYFPFNLNDSISFKTMNIGISAPGQLAAGTITFSIGLYSLNSSTLSIANSLSSSFTWALNAVTRVYLSLTATSATQNITPGTWYFGFLASTSGTSVAFYGASVPAAANAFPGAFIGGAKTASTNALPTSEATSDLDITGSDEFSIPVIILSA